MPEYSRQNPIQWSDLLASWRKSIGRLQKVTAVTYADLDLADEADRESVRTFLGWLKVTRS